MFKKRKKKLYNRHFILNIYFNITSGFPIELQLGMEQDSVKAFAVKQI